MTVATSQGQLMLEGGVYCNVIIIVVTTIQKPDKVHGINNSTCYNITHK